MNDEDLCYSPAADLVSLLSRREISSVEVTEAVLRRIGALDEKGGGILHGGKFYQQPTCHWRPQVEHGIMADECGQILKDFFKSKRK